MLKGLKFSYIWKKIWKLCFDGLEKKSGDPAYFDVWNWNPVEEISISWRMFLNKFSALNESSLAPDYDETGSGLSSAHQLSDSSGELYEEESIDFVSLEEDMLAVYKEALVAYGKSLYAQAEWKFSKVLQSTYFTYLAKSNRTRSSYNNESADLAKKVQFNCLKYLGICLMQYNTCGKYPHELKKWGNPAVLSDYKPELITRNNVKYNNVQLLLKPAIL